MGSEFLRFKVILDKIPATEDETRKISDVLRIKTILQVKSGDESVVYESLTELQCMVESVKILEATGIGKSVSDLQNHVSKNIKQFARRLIQAWRRMVDEWLTAADEMQPMTTLKKVLITSEKEDIPKQGAVTSDQKVKEEPKVVPMKLKKVHFNSEKEDIPVSTPDQKVIKENNMSTRVYTHGVAEVLKIKGNIDLNKSTGDESVVCDSLNKLQAMGVSVKTLEETGIGKTVGALRKHSSKVVRTAAWRLIKGWKGMANEWITRESSAHVTPVSDQEVEATTEKAKNPKGEFVEIAERKRQEPKLQPQKRLKSQTMEKKIFLDEVKNQQSQSMAVKPNKPAASAFVERRRIQIPNTLSIEEKLEATKRKLQQGYNEAQNKKKQRRTQVLEVHDVLRLNLAPKHHQDSRFGRCTSSCVGLVR